MIEYEMDSKEFAYALFVGTLMDGRSKLYYNSYLVYMDAACAEA